MRKEKGEEKTQRTKVVGGMQTEISSRGGGGGDAIESHLKCLKEKDVGRSLTQKARANDGGQGKFKGGPKGSRETSSGPRNA